MRRLILTLMRWALFDMTHWYPIQTTPAPATIDECRAFLMTYHRIPWTIGG